MEKKRGKKKKNKKGVLVVIKDVNACAQMYPLRGEGEYYAHRLYWLGFICKCPLSPSYLLENGSLWLVGGHFPDTALMRGLRLSAVNLQNELLADWSKCAQR